MNKVPTLVAVLLALALVQSCDFFRHMAGRPDSAWISAKKARSIPNRLFSSKED